MLRGNEGAIKNKSMITTKNIIRHCHLFLFLWDSFIRVGRQQFFGSLIDIQLFWWLPCINKTSVGPCHNWNLTPEQFLCNKGYKHISIFHFTISPNIKQTSAGRGKIIAKLPGQRLARRHWLTSCYLFIFVAAMSPSQTEGY